MVGVVVGCWFGFVGGCLVGLVDLLYGCYDFVVSFVLKFDNIVIMKFKFLFVFCLFVMVVLV